jgi:hypothetical protein
MSLSISDILQIFNLAEYVRPWLPLTWRVYASSALIWSGILACGAVIALGAHFLLREKSQVDWRFLRDARPFAAGWGVGDDGAIRDYKISSIQLVGENISGHALHQISGEIALQDKRKLPLFIIAESTWTRTDQVEPVRQFALIILGGSFQTDGLGWPEFPQQMTAEQFIQAFGGCTVSVTIDGREETWTFSVEDIRRAVESQLKEAQEGQLRGTFRPEVRRKKQSLSSH